VAALARLHLVTDTRPGRNPLAVLRAALAAYGMVGPYIVGSVGPPVVQVRLDDSLTDCAAYELATRIAGLCGSVGATCLVNNRLHIALAVGAGGGHVGALDLPVAPARAILGPDAILGATARSADCGRAAVAAGASYLGVGPCFETSTKDGLPAPIGIDGLTQVAAAVPVPVIAIGGVTARRVPELVAAGAYGVAVVGAVSGAADPARATAELLEALALSSVSTPASPAVPFTPPGDSTAGWPGATR